MKKSKFIFVLLIIFGVTNVFANNAEVTEKVNSYVKAIKDRDTKALENVLSDELDFTRINNILNKKEHKNNAEFLEFVKSGQFSAWAKDISSSVLNAQDKIAVAVVTYGSGRLAQTEYLTLFKEKDGWVIAKSVCSFGKK